jgi:hypothetical protein
MMLDRTGAGRALRRNANSLVWCGAQEMNATVFRLFWPSPLKLRGPWLVCTWDGGQLIFRRAVSYTKTMRIFVINLARRPDRMAAMAAQLDRLGLAYERFDAVDGKTCRSNRAERAVRCRGRDGGADARRQGLHHQPHASVAARSHPVATAHAVILEDDVELSERGAVISEKP